MSRHLNFPPYHRELYEEFRDHQPLPPKRFKSLAEKSFPDMKEIRYFPAKRLIIALGTTIAMMYTFTFLIDTIAADDRPLLGRILYLEKTSLNQLIYFKLILLIFLAIQFAFHLIGCCGACYRAFCAARAYAAFCLFLIFFWIGVIAGNIILLWRPEEDAILERHLPEAIIQLIHLIILVPWTVLVGQYSFDLAQIELQEPKSDKKPNKKVKLINYQELYMPNALSIK